jgi:uncharacterized membrane protein (DUF485 family)
MDPNDLQGLTAAVAPVVMVSAAGLLFNGVQTKNLHLSDRIRALVAEARRAETPGERRQQIAKELALFWRRIRLSQWSLDMIYAALVCFVLTSLLLASGLWLGPPVLPIVITLTFVVGVALLIVALVLEFVEMGISLRTITIEMDGMFEYRSPDVHGKG